jgi:hypothetical protein
MGQAVATSLTKAKSAAPDDATVERCSSVRWRAAASRPDAALAGIAEAPRRQHIYNELRIPRAAAGQALAAYLR